MWFSTPFGKWGSGVEERRRPVGGGGVGTEIFT